MFCKHGSLQNVCCHGKAFGELSFSQQIQQVKTSSSWELITLRDCFLKSVFEPDMRNEWKRIIDKSDNDIFFLYGIKIPP